MAGDIYRRLCRAHALDTAEAWGADLNGKFLPRRVSTGTSARSERDAFIG
jgi:hypothetical protein